MAEARRAGRTEVSNMRSIDGTPKDEETGGSPAKLYQKLKIEDLERIREKVRRTTILREGAGRAKVTVHMGTCGIAAGARKIMSALLEEIEKGNIEDVLVTTSGCAGLCSREPMVTVELLEKPPVKYVDLTAEKMRRIFREHVLEGRIVKEYALAIGSERISL